MHIRKRPLLLALTVAAGGLGAGALSVPAQASTARAAAKTQAIRIVIKDVSTSEGTEPAFVGPSGVGAKTLFTAHAGKPVVLTIVNQSKTLHTFTVAGLGLNSIVTVGSTTTVKFTPKKAGNLTWVCTPPCGNWVMANDGYMKGFLKVAK